LIKEKMSSNENVRAMLILDIIGRPASYLVENLERIIEGMKKEKGVKIIGNNIKEPVPMKENKELFTTFAEIEVETDDIMYLCGLMFKYMPAHVEVISPEEIKLSNNGWSEILSELIRRLHAYDEVARIIQTERAILLKKIQELQNSKNTDKTSNKKIKKEKKK